MKLKHPVFQISIALYVVAQIFFLINVKYPEKHSFDEFHYVPAAKTFLKMEPNQNSEHPPLGKWLIAGSMKLFGDNSFGWRFMSTVFGALTLVGVFLLGIALFNDIPMALGAAAITFVNHLLFVQARIGMLDTFAEAFLVFALAGFAWAWSTKRKPREVKRALLFCGAFMGLSIACKWSSVPALAACIFAVFILRIFQSWTFSYSRESSWKNKFSDFEDWYSPQLLKDVPNTFLLLALVVVPFCTYFITFLPYLLLHRNPPYTIWDLFKLQKEMVVRMQSPMLDVSGKAVDTHPYMSRWWSWPLMLRPIWYSFDPIPGQNDQYRGVILLGNPLVMWGGLAALFACAWAWIVKRSREAFLITFFFCALYFCWAVVPRKVFFYYYYYPSGVLLSFALAYVFGWFEKRGTFKDKTHWPRWGFTFAAFCLFLYFLPVLAALPISLSSFRRWMWFAAWV